MPLSASQSLGAGVATFLAAGVEFIEALTVVLAVGAVRGWTAALAGASAALVCLGLAVAVFAPLLTQIPLAPLRFVVGAALLLFGLRWLRKSVRRAAGLIPLRDEAAAYARRRAELGQRTGPGLPLDRVAVATSFQIVVLEGAEVVAIVLAMDAGGRLLAPAATGAGVALLAVILLGILARRPVSRVPDNTLKLAAGILLSSFGLFWITQSFDRTGVVSDFFLPILIALATLAALASIRVLRAR